MVRELGTDYVDDEDDGECVAGVIEVVCTEGE